MRRPLHRGVKFDFEILEYPGRSGTPVRREVVRHPGAVIILPILADGRVVLIRNFRASVEGSLLELPAGTRSVGEDPSVCAHRELIEETGYEAGSLSPLSAFYTSPGLSDEWMWAFVARGLHEVGRRPEDDEWMTVEPTPGGRALEMVASGEIRDAKTMLVLLMAARAGVIG